MAFKETILVTGGAGFIGSTYLNMFVPKNPDTLFVNVDCLTYAGSLSNLDVSESKNYRFHKTDIRDVSGLEKIFAEYKPTGVINFAAESHVDVSIEHPALFVETNIVGTHNLLSLAKEHAVKRFLQISTDEVYGALNADDAPFTTSSPLLPNSPYSASKAAADMLVRSYHKTYGMDTLISRSSNNYGPRQDTTKLVPKFISNLLKGEPVPLYAEGKNIRDWLYVSDNVEAIELVWRGGTAGMVYNIGGGVELPNREVVKKLLTLTGRDESFIQNVPDRLGHDFRYAIDTSELERELGWRPKKSFDEGIKETFEFYKK